MYSFQNKWQELDEKLKGLSQFIQENFSGEKEMMEVLTRMESFQFGLEGYISGNDPAYDNHRLWGKDYWKGGIER